MALSERALDDTRLAFDGAATDYGRTNDENPLLTAMRRRTLACLTRHLTAGDHVLDLGCGPGADAEVLAGLGYDVTAIDWSPAMVEQARQRVRRADLARRVHVQQLGIHELDRLAPAQFDAAYADFGPLNCVPDLRAAACAIAARVKPGGTVVASIIGRICPWELALYAWKGQWRRSVLRFAGDFVAVPLGHERVWTRYYSPREVTAIFAAAGFRRLSLRALGLVVPPPYMEAFARRHPAAVARLWTIEDEIGAWAILREMGDHFLIALRKD